MGFLRQGERVTGVRAKDKVSGREFEIPARQIVNATGVWTDGTQAMVGERGQFHVRASKGIHLVVPRDRIHSRTGLILRTATSVLFIIPGAAGSSARPTRTGTSTRRTPAASRTDIDYLLDQVNRVLATPSPTRTSRRLRRAEAAAGQGSSTSKLSREHVVAHSAPGLVVVAGGKYRRTA